ncbi:MAG TPA: murein biosynthesis integral membrane protein MurJ [Gammaproteobacteria bacterium]
MNSSPTPVKKHSIGLLRASGTVGGMTLISRVLGFVRDMVVALLFGANAATDAFFVAFKIPNFFRRLSAEGAFSQAFVPVFAEYRERRDDNALRDLVSHVAGSLGALLFLVTTLGITAAPLMVLLFAPGFMDDPERYRLASDMLRLTFPYLFFISLVALAGGILNSYQRFAVPAFTPVFLNLCLIGCAFWLGPRLDVPIMALAWGALLAGFVQLAFQLPFLRRIGMLPRPRLSLRHEGVNKVIKLMLPAILGSAVVQINLLIDTVIASFLIAGSVSWLFFSDRLVEFPLGVFGIAIATVILPSLSQKHAAQDRAAFSRNLDWGLRVSLLVAVPAAIGLILLASPILTTLFQYGAFTPEDTRMSAYSLVAYSIGLPGFILAKILAPAFFARQDTRTPVRIAIYAMLMNLVMNLGFVLLLLHFGFKGAHAGLALATALAAWAQTGMLWWRLRRLGVYVAQPGWFRFLLQTMLASAVMAAALFYAAPPWSEWFGWTYVQRALWTVSLVSGGGLIYFLVLWLAGVRMAHFRGHH